MSISERANIQIITIIADQFLPRQSAKNGCPAVEFDYFEHTIDDLQLDTSWACAKFIYVLVQMLSVKQCGRC